MIEFKEQEDGTVVAFDASDDATRWLLRPDGATAVLTKASLQLDESRVACIDINVLIQSGEFDAIVAARQALMQRSQEPERAIESGEPC